MEGSERILAALEKLGQKSQDEGSTEATVESAVEKIQSAGKSFDKVKPVVSLVKDYITGAYREIPTKSIVCMIGAVVYFVSPIDAMPDVIPVVGMLDDVAVIGIVIAAFKSDLDDYISWKRSTNVETIPAGALDWCRENAPEALKNCSDNELWDYMKSTYLSNHPEQ